MPATRRQNGRQTPNYSAFLLGLRLPTKPSSSRSGAIIALSVSFNPRIPAFPAALIADHLSLGRPGTGSFVLHEGTKPWIS